MIAELLLAVVYLAPSLVLWIALRCGRYPGERVVRQLARAVRRCRRAAVLAPPPRPARTPIRGGRLLGLRLAGRGPPAGVV